MQESITYSSQCIYETNFHHQEILFHLDHQPQTLGPCRPRSTILINQAANNEKSKMVYIYGLQSAHNWGTYLV